MSDAEHTLSARATVDAIGDDETTAAAAYGADETVPAAIRAGEAAMP